MNFRLKQKKDITDISVMAEIPALSQALFTAVERNNEIDSHVYSTDTKLAEFFLGCGSHEFYHLMMDVEKGMEIFFATMLEEYINTNYTVRNDIVREHLNGIMQDEAFNRYDYYYNILKRHIGFKYSCYTDSSTFMDYISFGNCFFENSRGERLVLHIPDYTITKGIGISLSTQLRIELMGNSNIPGVRDAIFDFIRDAYNRIGSGIGKRNRAMNYAGMPVEIETISWDRLKIPAVIKNDIDFHIRDFVAHIDRFRESGIKSSRGIIIAGPPGNGKTMLAKILCANIDAAFFFVTPEDFINPFGDTKLADIYKMASRHTPAIVLIEDADIFLQQRTFNMQAAKLSEFLNLIDGIKENNGIITILTCNNPELLDEAVKNRPKRFDVIIEFPNPAIEQRREILIDKLEEHLRPEDTMFVDEAAEKFEGFSGAHLCEFAERLIMSKIYSNKEFIDAEIFDSEIGKFGFSPSKKKGNIGIR